jgi:hypothetical protein
MSAGGYWKGTNFQVTVYWPTLGTSRDFTQWGQVGSWVSKNEKVLNKKHLTELCKLVCEQFPEVNIVESRDFSGRCARWEK